MSTAKTSINPALTRYDLAGPYGYDTIADLRKDPTGAISGTNFTDRRIVNVFGHTTALDGFRGTYMWNPTSTRTDDGFNVIKPTNATTGRYELLEALWIGEVSTTDNTATALVTIPTVSNSGYTVVARVNGQETADHDETGAYVRCAGFQNDGGTLTLVGSVAATLTAESTAGWDCTFDANSTNIRLLITGASATAARWRGIVQITAIM